jgi:plasmid stabilization system protein ParE
MAYVVSLTERAERDLALPFAHIHAEDSAAALRWYLGLTRAILTLEDHPNRCPSTPENRELRHLLYGNKPHVCRVIFRVLQKQKQVEVLHIRHGARRAFRGVEGE